MFPNRVSLTMKVPTTLRKSLVKLFFNAFLLDSTIFYPNYSLFYHLQLISCRHQD